MNETFKPCAVIPVYNHGNTVAVVAEALTAQGMHCILVDDGSEPVCAAVLDSLSTQKGISLLRCPDNRGKGAAVIAGLSLAAERGYTHALQIDADGQHTLADVPAFLAAGASHPTALVGGAPVYGEDAPRSRLYGRRLTCFWVWINTLALDIPDAMCGFRLYPLRSTLPLLTKPGIGQRMDFDIEIVVRLHWRRVPMMWIPTIVNYPENGISHFDMLRDNARISRTHARLFFGMLVRAPGILARRLMPGNDK